MSWSSSIPVLPSLTSIGAVVMLLVSLVHISATIEGPWKASLEEFAEVAIEAAQCNCVRCFSRMEFSEVLTCVWHMKESLRLVLTIGDRSRKALICRKHMQFEVAHDDAWYGCEFQLIDPNYPIYTEPYSAILEPFPSTGVGGTGSSSKKGRPSRTTFYLREIVKPRVPVGLSLQPLQDNGGFELSWKTCYTKSDFISSNLKFQVNISRQSNGHWKTTDVGENHKRHFSKQELLRGHRYAFRVRAMPSGSYVNGFWSSWSSVLEKNFSAASCPDCTEGDDATWTDNWMLQLSPLGIILVGFLIVGGVVLYKWVKPSLWPEIPDAGKAFERIVQGKQSAAGFLNSTGSESLMVWEYQVSHIIDPETDE